MGRANINLDGGKPLEEIGIDEKGHELQQLDWIRMRFSTGTLRSIVVPIT